tara:strand:+ start:5800 stop:6075 length:276 start_codon:yes stop_codon:yes gene_type:complete
MDNEIPRGDYCYGGFGEMKDGVIRINGLCRYWKRTDHGTIKCEFLDIEQIPADTKGSYEEAIKYFGSEKILEDKTDDGLMWDQVKDCGINL